MGGDFGDGIPRYPTQLFEAGFHFIAFILLHHFKREVKTPGILFKYYLLAYFVFRFFIEFIRENQMYHFGLTIYQLICIVGFVYVAANMLIKNRKKVLKMADGSRGEGNFIYGFFFAMLTWVLNAVVISIVTIFVKAGIPKSGLWSMVQLYTLILFILLFVLAVGWCHSGGKRK